MTKWFNVERRTTGREVYLVSGESAEEAAENWMDGELIVSEVMDSGPYSVQEERA
jgi:hypothetical protein